MGYISEDKIEDIKNQVDIVSIISEYVDLKQQGANFKGLCPFHNEKTPSFTVSPQKGIFHCFGCGAGGDAISFIMKKEGLSYPEAIGFLADKLGIFLDTGKVDKKLYNHRRKLYEINNEVKIYYFHNLLTNQKPKSYLTNRGLKKENINKFLLGYADTGNASLYEYMIKRGVGVEDLLELGLVKKSQYGKGYYDTFRDRLMFPIMDTRKNIIGFGGRTLGDDKAKYMNSPESIVYHKGNNIYGVTNLQNISKKKMVLIVEGYMDVISLNNHGIDYAVACLGTALTEEQAKLISRYSKNVFICYDGDSAGINATERAIDIFIKQGIQPQIVTIPDGLDPDDFIKKYGQKAFEGLVDNSLNPYLYRFFKLKEKYDQSDIDGRIAFKDDVSTMVSKIDREVIRNEYIERFASEMEMEVSVFKKDVESKRNDKTKSTINRAVNTGAPMVKSAKTRGDRQTRLLVMEAMRFLVVNPSSYEKIQSYVTDFDKVTPLWQKVVDFSQSFSEKGDGLSIEQMEDFFKEDPSMDKLIPSIYRGIISDSYKLEESVDKFIKQLKIKEIEDLIKRKREELELIGSDDSDTLKQAKEKLLIEILDLNKKLKMQS